MKITRLVMPVTAEPASRMRNHHRLCAALSISTARTALKCSANRATETAPPSASARQVGTTGNSNMQRSVVSVTWLNHCQCLGAATFGHAASLKKVRSNGTGRLTPLGSLPAASAAACQAKVPPRGCQPARRSSARHASAPRDVVKTNACSRANSPHQAATQQQQSEKRSSRPASERPPATAQVPAVAFRMASSRAAAAAARAVSPTAARRPSCSRSSACKALFGYSALGDSGAPLSGSTARRSSHAAMQARSYVWPLGATTGSSIKQCEMGHTRCADMCSSKLTTEALSAFAALLSSTSRRRPPVAMAPRARWGVL
mmetsp:Transcript_117139/g.373077  ORF Transcript_117139/g.373077 Transcript_117139/m.373077 type:complete len:317 (-) Transcript_117139:30-980(-)